MTGVVFQFPGQGSQVVGMGLDLARAEPIARSTFEEADDALGFALSQLCWEGPEDVLRATENTQPALLTHSVAVSRLLADAGLSPIAAAGHSLGEFSAHVCAGSIEFADALRLVRERGEAMAETGVASPGAMAAVIGLDDAQIDELCAQSRREPEVLTPANFNSPGQIVISGSEAAVDRAVQRASEMGARLASRLNVSGAFHSPLMAPARGRLAAMLDTIDLREAKFPVVANVDADPVTEPQQIRSRLIDQLTAPVRWIDCVRRLRQLGATTFLELGPGKVLTGLLRRIDRSADGRTIGTVDELAKEVALWDSI